MASPIVVVSVIVTLTSDPFSPLLLNVMGIMLVTVASNAAVASEFWPYTNVNSQTPPPKDDNFSLEVSPLHVHEILYNTPSLVTTQWIYLMSRD